MRLVNTLTLVCVVAALVLGAVNQKTTPLIAAQKEKEEQGALKKVLRKADDFKTKQMNGKIYYEGYRSGWLVGYVIPVKAKGYSGDIEMMVGIDKEGTIKGLEILQQQETPGLGALCVEIKYGEDEPWFTRQFRQKKIKDLDFKNIETITGATITSAAIVNAVKKDAEEFLNKI